MKTKYNNIKFTTKYLTSSLILLLFALCACSDFLQEEPVSESSDVNFWEDQDDANSAIAGCYSLLRKSLCSGNAYYAYGDLPSDEFSKERDLSGEDYNDVQEINWNISVPSTSSHRVMFRLRNFTYFYSTIQQTNLCLSHIPEIPEDEYDDYDTYYNQFMGEAYFVRAFCYFYMARVWGDVPIIDASNPDEVDLTDYERSDVEVVLAKAIEDCDSALTYLPWSYANSDDYAIRANKGAAWALLAHIYAWQGNYEACELATSKILDKGYYSYVDRSNYLSIFEGQSIESIFEISKNEEDEASAGDVAFFLLRDDYLTTQTKVTLWPFDTLTLRQTLFDDKTDLRVQNGFYDFKDDYPVLLKYSNISYTSETSALSMNNVMVFRLAGIALLQAEAQAVLGKYESARTTLNEIRALAGLGESQAVNDELFEAVINERGRELFMEGHRFYDLVRLAKEKGIYKFGSSDSDKINEKEFKNGKWVWPIDPYLMELNPLFLQTTYWRSEMQ